MNHGAQSAASHQDTFWSLAVVNAVNFNLSVLLAQGSELDCASHFLLYSYWRFSSTVGVTAENDVLLHCWCGPLNPACSFVCLFI